MKKTVKIALGATLALGVFSTGLFSQQIYTKATTDWQTNAINKAQSELKSAADTKATSLSSKANADINQMVDKKVTGELQAKQDELNVLMEQYYKMKLDGLQDSPKFKDLEAQIETIKLWSLDQFKYQIDQTFATQAK